jgi:hypothetical protein
MNWTDVGDWLKRHGGRGASLVGALLRGDSATVTQLRKLSEQSEESIRKHIEEMERLRIEDEQARHHEAQETIRAGDKAEDAFVRRTRPGMAWVSLTAALVYVAMTPGPDVTILGLLLTLPWAYAGLRQVGKGIDSLAKPRGPKGQ